MEKIQEIIDQNLNMLSKTKYIFPVNKIDYFVNSELGLFRRVVCKTRVQTNFNKEKDLNIRSLYIKR